jgi:outer membrane lipoprotein-sorting protein
LKVLLGVFLALATMGNGVKVAGLSKAKSTQDEVDSALASLRQSSGVLVPIKKTSLNSLLGKEKVTEGRLYYWQGKLRLETDAPDETLLVLDGKTLWLATTLPEDMGGKTMVSKTSARSFKKSNTLVAALLENKKLLQEFKLKNRTVSTDEVHLEFVAKNGEASEIQKLDLWLMPSAGRLVKFKYWDDKENEVTFNLGDIKALDGDRKALFSYKPPKGAEITEF